MLGEIMLRRFSPGFLLRSQALALCLACLFAFVCSCGPKEPPLSPAAKKFKSEILSEIQASAPFLAKLAAQRNVEAMNKALAESFSKAGKTGRPLPSTIVVLDADGTFLTRYPVEETPVKQFSDYAAVQQVIKKKEIVSKVLYLADGSRIFAILAPLVSGDKLAGMAAFALRADDVQKHWQVSEEEFRVINFNI
jgi:hypothetical protein